MARDAGESGVGHHGPARRVEHRQAERAALQQAAQTGPSVRLRAVAVAGGFVADVQADRLALGVVAPPQRHPQTSGLAAGIRPLDQQAQGLAVVGQGHQLGVGRVLPVVEQPGQRLPQDGGGRQAKQGDGLRGPVGYEAGGIEFDVDGRAIILRIAHARLPPRSGPKSSDRPPGCRLGTGGPPSPRPASGG